MESRLSMHTIAEIGPTWNLSYAAFIQNERHAFRLHKRVRIAYEPAQWGAKGDLKLHTSKRMMPKTLFPNDKMELYRT